LFDQPSSYRVRVRSTPENEGTDHRRPDGAGKSTHSGRRGPGWTCTFFQLALSPHSQRVVGLTQPFGRGRNRESRAVSQLLEPREYLGPHHHARVPEVLVGRVIDERKIESLRQLPHLGPQQIQQWANDLRDGLGRILDAGHGRQSVEAGAPHEVQQHRLRLVGGGVP
jgi:hypothetical protein